MIDVKWLCLCVLVGALSMFAWEYYSSMTEPPIIQLSGKLNDIGWLVSNGFGRKLGSDVLKYSENLTIIMEDKTIPGFNHYISWNEYSKVNLTVHWKDRGWKFSLHSNRDQKLWLNVDPASKLPVATLGHRAPDDPSRGSILITSDVVPPEKIKEFKEQSIIIIPKPTNKTESP
jgi:hypothetical protein